MKIKLKNIKLHCRVNAPSIILPDGTALYNHDSIAFRVSDDGPDVHGFLDGDRVLYYDHESGLWKYYDIEGKQ